jgi:L,D-peptidoglycan transpeptidase YkuD (ErfK/YbiS/YcfS/YnhG family)
MKFFLPHKRKFILIAILLLISTGLLWGAVSIFKKNPPVDRIEKGRKEIAKAIDAQANIYSPKELALAERYWQEAMAEWKLSNRKSSILRNYRKTSLKADLAIENAEVALKKAQVRKVEIKARTKIDISTLKKSLVYIEFAISKFPLNHNIRQELTPISIALNEAEMAFSRNDLLTASTKVELIKTKTIKLKEKTHKLLEEYFSDYNNWVLLNDEMKDWSKKQNSVSIVVDKFSRKCTVYKAGKKFKEFEVELGVNWLGDKTQSGDRTTPEGKYKVTGKRSGSKTLYHKSLEINYPNEDDKRRFEQEKRKGNLPSNARIGGSIAIHGDGGRGIDWTEGCVALENGDMDILFSLCPIGTPVAIVGSLVPLDKIFEDF